jgi:hypothetical protein
LPPVVLVENAERARPATLTELAEPELLELYVRHLGRRPTFDDVVPPDVRRVLENHPPAQVTIADVVLKYYAVSATAPDAPLAEMRNLCLSRKLPPQLANDFAAEFPR